MKPLTGIVVSTKQKKTATVSVTRVKVHPVYQKRVRVKRKYQTHDEIGTKKGDRVIIQECRPVSKTKKWRVVEVEKSKSKNQKSKTSSK